MDFHYYPGCTLKTKAVNLEIPAVAAMAALDINLVELPRWHCCGAMYSQASDDLLHQIASVRNLIRVQESKGDKIVTICDFCYNTLQRANLLVRNDPEKMKTLNSFMDEEPDYDGNVEVVHLLQALRDDVGWKRISEAVQQPLSDLKVVPYYGCALLRPEEIAIDDVERPTILQDLLEALGASPIEFPLATECCGSYQTVANPDLVRERSSRILLDAVKRGAQAVVTSCPLCAYNLGRFQDELEHTHAAFRKIPVVYFTQLLAVAFGLGFECCHFELNCGGAEAIRNRLPNETKHGSDE